MADNIIAGVVVAIICVFAFIGVIDWVDGPDQVAPPVKIVNEEAIKETAKLTAQALEIVRENQIALNARQERIDYQSAIVGVYWPLALAVSVVVGAMSFLILFIIRTNKALTRDNLELRRLVHGVGPQRVGMHDYENQVARY